MKSYELLDTKHQDLFRVVDRDGNWSDYYHKPSGRYLRGVTTVLNQGYPKGPRFEEWLSTHTPDERDRILKQAGEKGDRVHRLIDMILAQPKGESTFTLKRSIKVFNRETEQDESLSNDEWDAILAWARFWQAHAPITYTSEATMFHLSAGFAGTADGIFVLTKACDVKTCKCNDLIGKIGLFDWKTSSGIRASYWSQVAAYANAQNLKDYLPKDKRDVYYCAVLRIGTNHKTTGGYEFKTIEGHDITHAYARFLSAKELADFENPAFEPSDIVEIPDALDIPVNVADLTEQPKSAKKRTKKASTKTAKVGKPKRTRKAETLTA